MRYIQKLAIISIQKMQNEESSHLCDVKYKLIFLGDVSVGKSSLLMRFTSSTFKEQNPETIAIDLLTKTLLWREKVYRLQLYDTAGQEKYRSLAQRYMKAAHCAVYVFDICNRESFTGLERWVELFKTAGDQNAIGVVVGSKIDKIKERAVQREEGQEWSRLHGMSYCETSASTGEGVSELFESIIDNISLSREASKQSSERGQESTKNQTAASQSVGVNLNKKQIVSISRRKKCPCCYI